LLKSLARALASFGALVAATPASAADCDRQCLLDLTDRYIKALVAHDPTGLPISSDLVFVENVSRMRIGEGLWRSASGGATQFSIHVPDARAQTAGWLGMLQNDGQPALVAIRLKLYDGKIAEAEHLVTGIRKENMIRLEKPRPGLLAQVPPARRLPRDELIRIGITYYPALDDNDGTLMPFAEDCERHENGMVTAGATAGPGPNNAGSPAVARDCAGQLSANVMAYIDKIDNRRVFAADPDTGLVMGLSHFRHSMDFTPYPVKALDGSTIMYDKKRFPFTPFDLPAAHIFKVGADGKVHEIEAMGFQTRYNAPTGWE
jgi:hypothetical protein